MIPEEITIPTGEPPTGTGFLDMVTNFAINNSKFVAIIIIIVVVAAVAKSIGGAVIDLLGKFVVPIGLLVAGAIIIGVSLLLK